MVWPFKGKKNGNMDNDNLENDKTIIEGDKTSIIKKKIISVDDKTEILKPNINNNDKTELIGIPNLDKTVINRDISSNDDETIVETHIPKQKKIESPSV